MSIKIKKNTLFFKNETTEKMESVDMVGSGADKTLKEIALYTNQKKIEVINKVEDVIKSIPDDYSELVKDTNSLKRHIAELVVNELVEQTYTARGMLVSDNWDSTGTGGYYDANGKWVSNASYRWFRIDGIEEKYQLSVTLLTGVGFIHVFDGEPSESTFVERYSSLDSSIPTDQNKAIIESNQIVIVQNTPTSEIVLKCNNKIVSDYGIKLKSIKEVADDAKNIAENVKSVAENTDNKIESVVDEINNIAPPVLKRDSISITFSNSEFIGNVAPSSNGTLNSNAQYSAYKYEIAENGKLYSKNFGNSTYCILAHYNGEPSSNTFIKRIAGTNISDFVIDDVKSGDYVIISCFNISNSFNFLLDYTYSTIPTFFVRKMNVAWFGDSISQLQQLPHRVAEYMDIVVNDCSFAGAPLTYGTEAYEGTGFLSLTSQIVNGDFSVLENALSKQGTITEDKQGNADRLKKLNFEEITDIVVMAGTNDTNNDFVTTSTDLTKFKDGMKKAIDTIQAKYPQINLYFISNPYRGDYIKDKHGNTLADFVEAEKEVCKGYNIPYYDLYHTSGINENTIGYYLTNDKLHQNENGDILMAKKIAKWLIAN